MRDLEEISAKPKVDNVLLPGVHQEFSQKKKGRNSVEDSQSLCTGDSWNAEPDWL